MGCIGSSERSRYGTSAPVPIKPPAPSGGGSAPAAAAALYGLSPAPVSASGGSASSMDDGGLDDLGWVPASGFGDPVTPGGRALLIAEEEVVASRKPRLPLRVQILLEGGWKDVSDEETRQICEYLRRGELQFTLHARGQNYVVDFLADEGASQMNVSTGKKRSLRVIDNTEDDGCGGGFGEDDGGRSRGRAGSGADSSFGGGGTRSARSGGLIPPNVSQQLEYGPQSRRGGASDHPYRVLQGNLHAQECFRMFEANEAKLCGEWAAFYHSYSFAALIYEVQAAVGSVLFRFRSQYAPLPRILVKDFQQIPDAPELVRRFQKEFASSKRDHHPSFRRVAFSAMCSLASTGPEACTAMVFIAGYSCKDLSFRSVLENLLESCYVPKPKVKSLADQIVALSEKHGLDVSQFGGKACGSGQAGHLLQIFVRRPLVDKLTYAAQPYGPIDEDRMPMSTYMNSNRSFQVGQARVVAHPKYFMRADAVRMYVASADPTFHRNRKEFQKELVGLLSMILGEPELRQRAASGIYGGMLPPWWSAEDQRHHAKF